MPKRKNNNEFDYLKEKIKKLEREIFSSRRKNVRIMRISTDSSSPERSASPPSRRARRSESQDLQTARSAVSPDTARCPDTAPIDDFVALLYDRPEPATTATQTADAPQSSLSVSAPPPPAAAAPAASATAGNLEVDTTLDDDLMEILGLDPTKVDSFGPEIHKEVALRFEHCATAGLTKEDRKELTEKHPIPINCKLVDAPALNPEMKAALSSLIINRDKAIQAQQKILATALSSLGAAITLLLTFKEKQPALLRLLIDTGRLLCERQHKDSEVRRQYVLSSLKTEMKEQMKITKIDSLLFGQDFQETLKTAKAINRSGFDLKATSSNVKPLASTKPAPGPSKNWRSSNQSRKQAAAPRSKETTQTSAPAATRPQRAGSSRASQRQRPTRR